MQKGETFILILILLLVTSVIFVRTFDPYYITTGSMVLTLVPGDLAFVYKMSYGYRCIDRDQEVTCHFQNSKVSKGDASLFNMPQVSFFSRVKDKSLTKALADNLELGKLDLLSISSRTPYSKRLVAVR